MFKTFIVWRRQILRTLPFQTFSYFVALCTLTPWWRQRCCPASRELCWDYLLSVVFLFYFVVCRVQQALHTLRA